MAAQRNERRPHLVVTGTATPEKFVSPQQGRGKSRTISVDRARHGHELRDQLDRVQAALARRAATATATGVEAPRGCYIEFESPKGFDLELKSLESASGIELVAVRTTAGVTHATVYVPQGLLGHFVKRVEQYLTEDGKGGRPKNQALIDSIAGLRLAIAESFWTDPLESLPERNARTWWEVWLRGDSESVRARFEKQAKAMGLEIGPRTLRFPDRTVVLALGTLAEFATSVEFLDTLAELRRPSEIGSFFTELPAIQQAEWARDLSRRTTAPPSDAIAICLLDTGVNRGHPLLSPVLAEADLHTCDPAWKKHDHNGHGTAMAGIAAYGDLRDVLVSSAPVVLKHHLESVKILPPPPHEPRTDLYGARTIEAVGYAEIEAPTRRRVISMSVAAAESHGQGLPTSWSSAVDALCAGTDGPRHLFFVCAGNIQTNAGLNYRDRNETESVLDPGQAWNALTVGAFTTRASIDESSYAGWSPVARQGDLSPTSTTSCTWDDQWPIKPDIVMEGGNMALSPGGSEADFPDSLSVLSTHHDVNVGHFRATGDTSAATAAAARVGALISAEYPTLWPETVRALMVDSAEWTPVMRAEIASLSRKDHVANLIRCFGFGVPDLERARWSAGNALTLVMEDELQPFIRDKSNEMHLHKLPWPRDALASLGEVEVELRVTLSYFVEPNPARRGWHTKHRYGSHGLRFASQRPAESVAAFRKRVNKAAQDDGVAPASARDDWLLGKDQRSKGSLHHDRWTGTAADLATREHIAVYPTIGWWRERLSLGRSESQARYALIVSVRTPTTSVDIYEPVATLVRAPVATSVRVG